MYPIIAQAIAAEQAADMRRAADAYRRTRGIRKQARAARPGRAIAAAGPEVPLPTASPAPGVVRPADRQAADAGSRGPAGAAVASPARRKPNWTPAERHAAITGRRPAAPQPCCRPGTARTPGPAATGQRQRAETALAGNRPDRTPAR
jgi:hypothetical protein